MKLTTYRHKWIHTNLIRYCEQIGISNIPKIVYSKRALIECSPNNEYAKSGKTSRLYGQIVYGSNTMFLNIKKFDKLCGCEQGNLEQTLIHELVHLRFRTLRHGSEFHKRIRNIYEGKWYPTYDGYIWYGKKHY